MALAGTAAKLLASLDLDTRPFEAGAKRAGATMSKMESRSYRVGVQMGKGFQNAAHNIKRLGIAAAGFAATGIAFSVKAASDLDESLSKSRVVFGQFSAEIEAWAAGAAAAFGQSKQQALEAAGTYGNLFQAFGVKKPKAVEMSKTLVGLAADLASFNNTSIDDALLALRSGLSGETEPLKRYGIAISDARLRTALAEQGFKDIKGTLTPLQKAQGAYTLILKDSKLAQGDFARTSGGLANQQRILRANLDNTAATIGTALLPKITVLATKINKLVTDNQGGIKRFADELPAVFDSIMSIVSNVPWGTIGSTFKLMGEGAKIALQAFSAMPSWVQTAVISGWGLNKLTGGAVGGIIGELGKGLIKGVLGINAGVVNVRAGTVTGGVTGGGVGPAGKAGGLASAVRVLGTIALAAGSIALIADLLDTRAQQSDANKALVTGLGNQTTTFTGSASLKQMTDSLANIEQYQEKLNHELSPEAFAVAFNIDGVADAIVDTKAKLVDAINKKMDEQEQRLMDNAAKLGVVKTALDSSKQAITTATRSGDRDIVAAIRANKAHIDLRVNVSNTSRVSVYQTGGTISRTGPSGTGQAGSFGI